MPKGVVKTKKDEAAWNRAKGIIRKQYPQYGEDNDSFWALVQHVYQNMIKSGSYAHKTELLMKAYIITEGSNGNHILDNYFLLYSHIINLQKAAYKLQGRMKFHDLDISIENRKGSVRKGTDGDGHEWKIKMKHPYGYIRLTEGADGDHVDCYMGDNEESRNVFVIHQNDPTTHKYDEDKVMLGFVTASEAKKAYLEQYDRPGFFGSIEKFDIDKFQDKVKKKKGKVTGGDLVKAIAVKRSYSKEDIKDLNLRWVTVRGNHVLVQGLEDGSWVVVGGAGGKLAHFRIEKLLSKEEYARKQKEKERRRIEELTPEQIREQAKQRKEEIKIKKEARQRYKKTIEDIIGAEGKDIRSMIKVSEMDDLEKKARTKVAKEKRKGMRAEEIEEQVEEKLEEEIEDKMEEKVKDLELQAVNVIASDYMEDSLDANEKKEIKSMLNLETAEKILKARRIFKKQIKEINIERGELPKKVKFGETLAESSKSIKDEVLEEVQRSIETQKNIQLYEKLNQQSLATQQYIDQGCIDSLNGIIGDIYKEGAVFGANTIQSLGLEACVRMITTRVQAEGRTEVVKNALIKFAQKNNLKLVQDTLRESNKRFEKADSIRAMAKDTETEEGLLCMASANGYALRQVVKGQQALGSAVGSLRATAHLVNALEEPAADSVLVGMGRDLFRARKKAQKAGLKRGEYSMRSHKGELVMEIPKETLKNFFKKNIEERKIEEKVDKIKMHKENNGYLPEGMKKGVKLKDTQEAGLRFFMEKDRVLLDFEAGLGKTFIGYAAAMEAMHNKGAKKVLIVTPAKLRMQFYKDRRKCLEANEQKEVTVCGEGVSPAKRRDNYSKEGIAIIGHEQLRTDSKWLKDAGFDMVVIDEIHEMTNPEARSKEDSQRFRGMMELKDIPLKIGMSGTNIKNSKKELYKKINFIDPEHTLGTLKDFDERFKGLNQGTTAFAESASNAFRQEIAPWSYTQKNVMKVKNNVQTIRIKLTPEQRKAYKESEKRYGKERTHEQKRRGAAGRRDTRNYDVIHVLNSGKNGNLNFIKDTMDKEHPREKAVIHVSRLKSMRTVKQVLEEKYGEGCARVIHGDSSKAHVEDSKKEFNDQDSKVRFLIGTKSLENGHNLQHGGTVTFNLDIPDTYSSFEQRMKRVYRHGQDRDVSTYLLVSDSPYDVSKEDILEKKERETKILGNPREIEGMDETGFLGILNSMEREKGTLEKAKKFPEGTIREWKGKKYKKVGNEWKKIGEEKKTIKKDYSKMDNEELESEYTKESKNLERYNKMPNTRHKVSLMAITASNMETLRFYIEKEEGKKLARKEKLTPIQYNMILIETFKDGWGKTWYKGIDKKTGLTLRAGTNKEQVIKESLERLKREKGKEKGLKVLTTREKKQYEEYMKRSLEIEKKALMKATDCNVIIDRGAMKRWGKEKAIQAIKDASIIMKGIHKYVDIREYFKKAPSKRLNLKIVPGLTKDKKVGGQYQDRFQRLLIGEEYPDAVVHEIGHYLWYKRTKMRKEFVKWAEESGYRERVEDNWEAVSSSEYDYTYWTDSNEMFARAFAAYIGYRAKTDQVTLKSLAIQKPHFYTVAPTDNMFKDDEFKNIMKRALGEKIVKAMEEKGLCFLLK